VARATAPEADLEVTGVYTVRKQTVSYQEFFWDHGEALEVVGLSEELLEVAARLGTV
jgi:hypothetical protein